MRRRVFGLMKAAGTMWRANFLPSYHMVCAALTEPVRTQKSRLSFRAKYEIIFPLPSSPQKAPTITEHGIAFHVHMSVQELFKAVGFFWRMLHF